jgi:hypothetical protein
MASRSPFDALNRVRDEREGATMAARDRGELTVSCTGCGTSGVVEHSEDDHPWMRRSNFTVDHMPEGFAIISAGDSLASLRIRCTSCGAQVR